MDRFLRRLAYAANAILVVTAFYISAHSYHVDSLLALLLAVPPLLSLRAMYVGPDAEERRLLRDVSKARLRRELKELEGKST